MKFLRINEDNLKVLLDNLRKEDEDELKHTFGADYKKKFIKITLKVKEYYFASDDNGFPLAIGGVEKINNKPPNIGQVWLISSNKFTKNNLELIKFIKSKIDDFKKDYDILFNAIYKSNYKSLKWLSKCGFRVLDISGNKNFKLFYFAKGGINFDLRYITGQ